MKKSFVLLAAVLGLLVAGCESGIQSRIQEKSAVYEALAPWQQRDVQAGNISVGFSTDMVYMALGKPSKVVTSANGEETVWTFNNYYPPSSQLSAQTVNTGTTGGAGYSGSMESSNAPRNTKSLSSTSTRGNPQTQLSVPDMPSDTLYVTFRDGQVVGYELESQRSQ